MKITLLTVGKIKESYLTLAIQDYITRLKPFTQINIEEIKESLLPEQPSNHDIERALEIEAEMILKRLNPKDGVIVLDLHHPQWDSPQLADRLEQWKLKYSTLVFIIGSSYGLSSSIKNKANALWTLSSLTLPHGLVRLFVLEQLYRAFKINHHQTYHK